ncbi:hypothetical protein Fcan01_22180 [Folsomia candida]|uniref:Uncharacterized protein n=1 Tax=Folsomia candida TaxID=158441 RepID=A0A226DEV7_FOLCA|nr:hypothetical protein Fcan01_22180 [Folsomia candida]
MGGFVPSLAHLILRPDFIFVLVIRDNLIPSVTCYDCLIHSFSVYLMPLQMNSYANDFVKLEDLPIRYSYVRQLQQFEPILNQHFVFGHLYSTPLFPPDTNHRGFPVTIKLPGTKDLPSCHA